MLTPEAYVPLLGALTSRGLRVKQTVSSEPDASVPDIALLEGPPGPVRRADLLIAKTEFEREAIERAVIRDLGVSCRVVRPEHLIVYKLIAGRPRDYGDASEVMRTCTLSGAAIDVDLVRRWTQEWGVEDRLQRLLDDAE